MMLCINNFLSKHLSNTFYNIYIMNEEEIDNLLITIVKEFVKPENFQRILDEQVLANAIFYSFVVGRLKHIDNNEEEIVEDIQYVQSWIEDKQDLLLGFKV